MSVIQQFTVRSPREIIVGWGAMAGLGETVAGLGHRPLLVVGGGSLKASGRLAAIMGDLEDAGLSVTLFEGVEHDPSTATIDRGREGFRAAGCDCVVAIGGGSAMDAGKAIAGLSAESTPTAEFVRGLAITAPVPPIVACTTTSGTGSEVTHVSVLTDTQRAVKASIRTAGMMPSVAVVDAELTVSLPRRQTAFSGLDALTQAIESYVSVGANPFSDPPALEATVRIARWLRTACEQGGHQEARENMAVGSMLAGLALASARLGLVHGIAHPLGALYGLAHGEACALLLPYVMEFNAEAGRGKFARLAREANLVAADRPEAEAGATLVAWTRELCEALGCLRPFADFGLKREDYGAIVEAAMASGSTKANPRRVTPEDVVALLDRAM